MRLTIYIIVDEVPAVPQRRSKVEMGPPIQAKAPVASGLSFDWNTVSPDGNV